MEERELSAMGKAALALAKRGFAVFPVTAMTNDRPHVKGWGNEATTDAATIARWWTRWPSANVAVACAKSGLALVDLDQKKGNDGRRELDLLELDHGELERTLTATTPTGGTHLYFRGKLATTVSKVGRGIDTRGVGSNQGGYVLCPPSVRPEGPYEWANDAPIADVPAWLAALAGRASERRRRKVRAEVELDTPVSVAWARHHLERDARPAVEGQRGDETTFRVACTLRERGITEATALELMGEAYNPRCQPPWDPDELAKKVKNAYDYASVSAPGGDTPEADFGPPEGDPSDAAADDPRYRGPFEDWVWVADAKWFVRRSDGKRLDERSWNSLHNYLVEGSGQLSEQVFKAKRSMRKFSGFCFRPGQDEFAGELYNLWRPSGVVPVEGDASWLEDHVAYLFPDERERGLCLDYLAWLAQRQDAKLAFALLVQGKQGTGKSFMGQLMERILGEHNTSRPSNDELHSDFNAWASGCSLVVIEELMTAGRRETANKLKTLITDPRVRVNEKHKHPYTIENAMNFLVFTNWEDPIPIDNDDRRYLVLMSPADPRPPAYYDALFRRLGGDGPGVALNWLLKRDISAFNGRGRAPMTEGKEAMRRASMSDVEAHLLELYEAGAYPLHGDVVCASDLVEALPERLRRAPRLHNILGSFLRREIGAQKLGQHRLSGGSQRVLWSVRRHELVSQLKRADVTKRYEAQMASDAPQPETQSPAAADFPDEGADPLG